MNASAGRRLFAALLACSSLSLTACEPPPHVLIQPKAAGAVVNGRAATSAAIAAEISSGRVTIDAYLDAAHSLLDGSYKEQRLKAVPGTDATIFAGAVLDAALQLESTLPQGGDREIFWMRMGRLAFRAAEEAHAQGRIREAGTLVFAGPRRWQNESYWMRYSDHDALAAVILARNGDREAAIRRLRDRSDLSGPALEVYQMLMEGR